MLLSEIAKASTGKALPLLHLIEGDARRRRTLLRNPRRIRSLLQAIQELKIEQLEQEIAVLKQRNADLVACLDEAVAYIHRLKPKVSARIVAEIDGPTGGDN